MSEAPLPVEPARARRPRVGYVMAASAATLWAVNGTVSKVILASGISSLRLSQVRSTGALVGLVLVLLVTAPSRLRVRARELPFLAVFGICGLAFVQWFYFLAIHRLAIGIALLIEYLAPLLVALWARFVFHEPVRRRIWARARARARRPRADRRRAPRRRRSRPPGIVVRARRGGHLRALHPARRARASATATPSRCSRGASASPRSSGRDRAVVELPRPPRRRRRLAARPPRATTTCPVWALMTWMIVLGHDRPVLPARERAAAPAGDTRRDHRDARAGRRDGRRLGLARRVARRRSSSPAPSSCSAAIVLAQTAR